MCLIPVKWNPEAITFQPNRTTDSIHRNQAPIVYF